MPKIIGLNLDELAEVAERSLSELDIENLLLKSLNSSANVINIPLTDREKIIVDVMSTTFSSVINEITPALIAKIVFANNKAISNALEESH